MSPLADPRPLAEVLRDWLARHGTSHNKAARSLGLSLRSMNKLLAGGTPAYEFGLRAVLHLIDAGRLPAPEPRDTRGRRPPERAGG